MTDQTMFDVLVARKTNEALGICTFELVPTGDVVLPPFSAGSHIDVHAAPGLIRQYSLCNDPAEKNRYTIGVLRDPSSRGGSAAMHELVEQGSLLRISAPRNHFPLAAQARRSILLAGGIGITPLLCMAERLAVIDADFEMHYCTRSPERTAFRDRIRSAPYRDRVQFHYDDGDDSQRLDIPSLLHTPADGVHLYVCGPRGFLDSVVATASSQGWRESDVHFEYFSGNPVEHSSDFEFEVKVASSGQVIKVAAQQSVAAALAAAGVAVPVSCEQGVCGTCITRVLEGEVDHRDLYFSEGERALNDQFTPCCSRARSRMLVLDL